MTAPAVWVWNGSIWTAPPEEENATYGPVLDYGHNPTAISEINLRTSEEGLVPVGAIGSDLIEFIVADSPAQYAFGIVFGAVGLFRGGVTVQGFQPFYCDPVVVRAGETYTFQWSNQIDLSDYMADCGGLAVWFNTSPDLPTQVPTAANLLPASTEVEGEWVDTPGYEAFAPLPHMIESPRMLYPNPN